MATSRVLVPLANNQGSFYSISKIPFDVEGIFVLNRSYLNQLENLNLSRSFGFGNKKDRPYNLERVWKFI